MKRCLPTLVVILILLKAPKSKQHCLVSDTYGWDKMYLAIREANVALENLPTATFTNATLKDRFDR
jgi:hypothetical protein